MKKTVIATLVGGLILFFWQFLSWGLLNLHKDMQEYTPNQEKIIEFLSENLEEGFYFMPNVTPGQDEQAAMEANKGKPWAQVYYHEAENTNMGMNMVRGLLVDFLSILLLVWIVLKMGNASFQTIVLTSLAIGLISFLSITYTYSIWYQTKTLMGLLDAVVSWALVGVWLGWWIRR